MSDDVVQLHVDAVDDLLATHETSGPRPRRTPAAAPAIGASEQTWDAWASLTGHKRGSATWLSVRAEAASKTPEAIARRLLCGVCPTRCRRASVAALQGLLRRVWGEGSHGQRFSHRLGTRLWCGACCAALSWHFAAWGGRFWGSLAG